MLFVWFLGESTARHGAPISLRLYLTFRHSNLLQGDFIEAYIYNYKITDILSSRTKIKGFDF